MKTLITQSPAKNSHAPLSFSGMITLFQRPVGKISYRLVTCRDDYLKVLNLRRDSYSHGGKIEENAPLKTLICPTDRLSEILMAFHGDVLVASASLFLPLSEDTVLDTQRTAPASKDLPAKTDCIEISRLCILPDYQGKGTFNTFISEIYRRCLLSGRRYVVSSSSTPLIPLYKRLGFKATGLNYRHPDLLQIPHTIIVLDLHWPLSGWRISPKIWQKYYKCGSKRAPASYYSNMPPLYKMCLILQTIIAVFISAR